MSELLSSFTAGWGAQFLRAASMTVIVSACAFSLGLAIGAVAAWARLHTSLFARIIGSTYTTVSRGVPELLIIYLFFFGGNSALIGFVNGVLGYEGRIELNAFSVAVIALSLIAGGYFTEVLRGAYAAIPKGQLEAATAMGLRRSKILRRIIAPQLFRYALPGCANIWQLLLKDSALVSVTGLVEIMRQSQIASNSTREPFFFYSIACVLFIAITMITSAGFRKAEKRLARGYSERSR
ncbi:ABC transporter permease subunit [bacterium M00.F.Ca.ET.194.01.1.1]|nr:ABC transporter permease subunit [bacterium M00.F.Ca.ET.194.01.1.1]TGS52329.1 ABC transporter permease subunit [bacterium M00.F.Ca.ET.179.01.1.1]TGV44190.1 ABC transporter permease subunit [bacterium M00.F.Ca.ET.168.01.1.1]